MRDNLKGGEKVLPADFRQEDVERLAGAGKEVIRNETPDERTGGQEEVQTQEDGWP